MSYDLFFYKRKGSPVSREDISNYLMNIPYISNENNSDQWWYENTDTEVYFSFEYDEFEEEFEGFESVNFQFNINFMRPDFFGREAFLIVSQLITALDLFVFNPQFGAESDEPHQPSDGNLYNGWSSFNLTTSREHFNAETVYYPLEACNASWEHNFQRKRLQEELGDDCFAPRIFYFKTRSGEVITVATWSKYIPTLIPVADYYLLNREYKRFFMNVEDKGFVSYNTLLKLFGSYIEPFVGSRDCKIIRAANAAKAGKVFNSLKFDHPDSFAKRIGVDRLYNSKPA